jgi:hypothetical protein
LVLGTQLRCQHLQSVKGFFLSRGFGKGRRSDSIEGEEREREWINNNFSPTNRTDCVKNSLKYRTRRLPGSTRSKVLVFENIDSVEAHSFTPTYATQIEAVNTRLPKQ